MDSRFFPIELLRGHWKGLSDYRSNNPRADKITRISLIGLPLIAGGLMLYSRGELAAPGSLLAGVALLAGGFLAAFGQISTLRLKLTERRMDFPEVEQIDRDSLDETAAHLLVASLFSALTALVLVLGMNLASYSTGAIYGPFAAIAVALATYVLLVFVISVPRLYTAYLSINHVRDELSGAHRRR
jgi:ABC-type multidrug transport system fused ATPase/permease subunit